MKAGIETILGLFGYEIFRTKRNDKLTSVPFGDRLVSNTLDFTNDEIETVTSVKPFTSTGALRIIALIRAIQYIEKNNIDGSIVECEVYRGGSMMAAAKSLMKEANPSRKLYLFDTFEGMSSPTQRDVNVFGTSAAQLMKQSSKNDKLSVWSYASLSEVERNLQITGYPRENMYFIPGKVEETIPKKAPEKIALLRLDTDWYESTLHELLHLYPRLVKHGVLMIDDYGHWKGAREATDEYFKRNGITIFLNRVDYTCRLAIKVE
jgi:O-methyltransferase